MKRPARHLAIRRNSDIFTGKRERLYHWAEDRRVPADNNLAERDLRPSVHCQKNELRLHHRRRGKKPEAF
jgi:hypothetical protein